MLDLLKPLLSVFTGGLSGVYIYAAVFAAGFGGGWWFDHKLWMADQAEAYAHQVELQRQADAVEMKNKDLNTKLEADHAQHQHAIDTAHLALNDVASELDRVRKRCSPAAPVPEVPKPAPVHPGSASVQSGAPAGSFQELAGIAADAVAVAEYARVCHEWAKGIEQ